MKEQSINYDACTVEKDGDSDLLLRQERNRIHRFSRQIFCAGSEVLVKIGHEAVLCLNKG